MSNLSYNYSGEWEDVRKALRNYPTDVILKRICKEGIEFEKSAKKSDVRRTKWVEYQVFNTQKRAYEKREILIATWNLIDLAYYAVMASNDYRGDPEISDTEFYVLADAVTGFTQKREDEQLDTIESGSKEVFMRLWGFAGEQFKVQDIHKAFNIAGRELYILFVSSKKTIGKTLDIPELVKAETGFDWQKIICVLFLAWVYFSDNCVYSDSALANMNPELLSKSEFLTIIERYSIDYDGIRNSELGRQVFYTRPYIITQKKELLGISPYLNLCIYEHCVFWIVREFFRKQNSQTFTDFFGSCFEKYFEELLECSLERSEFEKIPEGKDFRADWRLEIDGFRFLVEQKSSIMRLNIKQQETNIGSIKEFAKKVIIKAVDQLDRTEKEFEDGPYIKIVLLYDDYLMPAIIEQVFEMDECNVENDGRYWLASIEEMEILLSLCQNQRDVFDAVIREKNHREMTHSNLGRSLLQLLSENGINSNDYLEQERIAYYRDFAKENSLRMLNQ